MKANRIAPASNQWLRLLEENPNTFLESESPTPPVLCTQGSGHNILSVPAKNRTPEPWHLLFLLLRMGFPQVLMASSSSSFKIHLERHLLPKPKKTKQLPLSCFLPLPLHCGLSLTYCLFFFPLYPLSHPEITYLFIHY